MSYPTSAIEERYCERCQMSQSVLTYWAGWYCERCGHKNDKMTRYEYNREEELQRLLNLARADAERAKVQMNQRKPYKRFGG